MATRSSEPARLRSDPQAAVMVDAPAKQELSAGHGYLKQCVNRATAGWLPARLEAPASSN